MKKKWRGVLLALAMSAVVSVGVACGGDNGGDAGGGTNVENTPTKLGDVALTIDNKGLATWEEVENASKYEYTLDGGATYAETTDCAVQLQAGQSIKVRAVGDGVSYRHGNWSETLTFENNASDDNTGDDNTNDEHTVCKDENNDHDCDVCGKPLTTCKDENNDHDCDVCGEPLTTCKDENSNHDCDVCGKELSQCADNDKDHDCDVCGDVLTDCTDVNPKDGNCDICEKSTSYPGDDTTGNVLFTGLSEGTLATDTAGCSIDGTTVTTSPTQNWTALYITLTKDGKPLTQEDLATYRYVDITIEAEQAGTQILFRNCTYPALEAGDNVLRVPTHDILYQLTLYADAYDFETGKAFFQIREKEHTLTIKGAEGVIEDKKETPSDNVGTAITSELWSGCKVPEWDAGHLNWHFTSGGTTSEDFTRYTEGDSSYKLVASSATWLTIRLAEAETYEAIPKEKLTASNYDYLYLDVYNEGRTNVDLNLYSVKATTLVPGWNKVKIPMATVEAQIKDSDTAYENAGKKGLQQYDDGSYFYFNVSSACTLYFDNVRAVKDGVVDLGNVFILGDSYSTYAEYTPYGTDSAWYGTKNTQTPEVNDVSKTWWWQLLNETNSNLLVNASYSGTTICNTGYSGVLGEVKSTSFTTRLQSYIDTGYFETNKVDTFLLFGGTNDIWANSTNKFPIGELKYADWTEEDLNYILPAFCYLLNQIKTGVKPTRIVVIINDDLWGHDAVALNKYKEACLYYGVDVVELVDVAKTAGHPNDVGMTTVKTQILQVMKERAYSGVNPVEGLLPETATRDENCVADFRSVSQIGWIGGTGVETGVTLTKALTNNGVQVSFSGDSTATWSGWPPFGIFLTKEDGTAYTAEEILEFNSLTLTFNATGVNGTSFGLADPTAGGVFAVVEGENTITFTQAMLQTCYDNGNLFIADGSLYLTVNALSNGLTFEFISMTKA